METYPRARRFTPGNAPKANSFEVWRGPSLLTDEPIVAIASGIGAQSLNPKTGAMVQVYFLNADVSPADAVARASTRAICGECIHAPHRDGTCYVNPAFGAHQLWQSWRRGDCPILPPTDWKRVFGRRYLRLGAYGDPASAPAEVPFGLSESCLGHTGYTHAWRDRPDLRRICMASVGSEEERLEAEALGWRAFRVVPMDKATRTYLEPVPKQVAVCGASIERGKRTTCIECGACGGLSSKANASIVVGAHGSAIVKHAGLRGLGEDARRYPVAMTGEPAEALPLGGAWGFVA